MFYAQLYTITTCLQLLAWLYAYWFFFQKKIFTRISYSKQTTTPINFMFHFYLLDYYLWLDYVYVQITWYLTNQNPKQHFVQFYRNSDLTLLTSNFMFDPFYNFNFHTTWSNYVYCQHFFRTLGIASECSQHSMSLNVRTSYCHTAAFSSHRPYVSSSSHLPFPLGLQNLWSSPPNSLPGPPRLLSVFLFVSSCLTKQLSPEVRTIV